MCCIITKPLLAEVGRADQYVEWSQYMLFNEKALFFWKLFLQQQQLIKQLLNVLQMFSFIGVSSLFNIFNADWMTLASFCICVCISMFLYLCFCVTMFLCFCVICVSTFVCRVDSIYSMGIEWHSPVSISVSRVRLLAKGWHSMSLQRRFRQIWWQPLRRLMTYRGKEWNCKDGPDGPNPG